MATNRAIAATSATIVRLLVEESQRDRQLPQCTVRLVQGALHELAAGAVVGVHLYRVSYSDVQADQTLPVPGGPQVMPSITVDLHYLVTALAAEAETSQQLLGWAVSVLNANPVLRPTVLNTPSDTKSVFEDGESVSLVWEPLSLTDLHHVRHSAAKEAPPSATYVARAVRIDS